MQHNHHSHCTTVPRKRRPRAVGEVSITSHSSVYVNHDKTPTTMMVSDDEPVYQNAETASSVLRVKNCISGDSKTKELANKQSKCHFVVFTMNHGGEPDKKNIDSTGNVSSETQSVTVFVGKTIYCRIHSLSTITAEIYVLKAQYCRITN